MSENANAPQVSQGSDRRAMTFYGPRMVVLAFLAYNFAIGLHYGVYGTLVGALQKEFGTTRALAGSGLSVMSLVMGLVSPLAGQLLQRRSLRSIMIVGASLNAAGFLLLAFASSIWFVLGVYALVIGPGVCLLGIIPSATLISNWYIRGRGRALGIVNTPLLIFIVPPVSARILAAYDIRVLFAVLCAAYVALIPWLLLVVTRPEQIGQRPLGAETARTTAPVAFPTVPLLLVRQIVAMPQFWLLTLAIGVLTAGGTVIGTHLVPMVVGLGFSLQAASILMSAYGVSAAVGTLLFGWLADRVGANRTIMLNALLQIAPWLTLFLGVSQYLVLLAAASSLGLLCGSVIVLHGAAMAGLVGRASFSRAMGISYFMKIPFMFAFVPLAGYIFDITGTYSKALLIHLVGACGIGLIYLYLEFRQIAVAR
jgi:MFS family permease